MDGFKDSTRMKYMTGGPAKRAEAKMGKVMGEFASGKLHSGSKKGPEVTNPKQAVAIAMSEARKAAAKKPVKMAEGGTYNERGKRATLAELEAEDRRMAGRPVEGVSSRPTDASGRRATDAELGMTPGGVSPAKKKAMPKGVGAMSDLDMQRLKEVMKKPSTAGAAAGALAGAGARAAAGALAGAGARAGVRAAGNAVPRGMGAMSDLDMQRLKEAAKKAVPSYSDRPMIRRSKGGLAAMPKGKC